MTVVCTIQRQVNRLGLVTQMLRSSLNAYVVTTAHGDTDVKMVTSGIFPGYMGNSETGCKTNRFTSTVSVTQAILISIN